MGRILFDDDDASSIGAFLPPTLDDPVVGNIGLLKYNALVLLHLTEPNGVYQADAIGNLGNLAPDTGTTAPSSVPCWADLGRQFVAASSNALIGADLPTAPALTTLALRDVTVQAIISLTLVNTTPQTIIQRGVHDGTSGEPICYGLAVQQEPANPGLIDVFWYWEDSAGVIHSEQVGTYAHPGDGKFFLLTATRRWEGANKVVCRYYADDHLLAEIVTTDGDIAGGTTGHTVLGGKKASGTWSQFFNGTIDDLKVTNYEMSAAEVRETWRRLYVHQPAGVEMFAGLSPPGAPWYRNPGNRIGKLVKLAGEALGLSIAKIEEMRAMWLPDQASKLTIARWEAVCGIAARPLDSLDVRRARVVSYLSRLQGFSDPAVQQAIAPLLGLTPSQVQILEFSNRITEPFSAALDPQRWDVQAGGGAWSVTGGGELQITAAMSSSLQFEPARTDAYARAWMANANKNGSLALGNDNFIAQIKLSTYWANLPANTIVGLYLQSFLSKNTIWFGVKNVGGTLMLGYTIYTPGALAAFVPIVNPSSNVPYWLCVMPEPAGGLFSAGTLQFGYSTAGPTGPFTFSNVATGITDLETAGAGAMSTDASLAAALTATFDDFLLQSNSGDRPFHWYAFCDPALGSTPDIVGAELLLQKIKPAHTYAGVCQSKSVLHDDPVKGLHDRGPCGAL